MPEATILFADNDPDFLATIADFLKQEGYLLIIARNPTEARRTFEAGGTKVDLAILDIRLKDDNDETDVSGLTLAREVARAVPKIILTGFASWKYVREALKGLESGTPVAVDFVAKEEGQEALLRAVRRALDIPRVGFGARVSGAHSTDTAVFIVRTFA